MEKINDLVIIVGTRMGPLTHIDSLFFCQIHNQHTLSTYNVKAIIIGNL